MSPNKEDYLKIIFELGGATQKVSNKQILAGLNVTAASVSEMVNKLVQDKLATHTPYQGIQLTQAGRERAAILIRKHRLWETFLVDRLGYGFNDVHGEAEVLEHVTSDNLANHLDDFLDHPKRCPHGGVIPDQIGGFNEQTNLALIEIKPNQIYAIDRVFDDRELLDYMVEIGLTIDDQISLEKLGLFESPMTIRDLSNNRDIQVGIKAANHIFVRPVK